MGLGSEIQDPEKTYSGSGSRDQKGPGSGSAILSGTLILTFGVGSGFTLLLFPIMGSFILRSFTVVSLCYAGFP
jgi:hypothetical protein